MLGTMARLNWSMILDRLPAPAIGLAALMAASTAAAADLKVVVHGVRPGDGNVRVALYEKAEGFRHEQNARSVLSVPATSGDVSVTFPHLPAGRYAVIAYHDENGNKKLDLLMSMFPQEGWGLSNDPTVIGPPGFDASAFDLADKGANVDVKLHY